MLGLSKHIFVECLHFTFIYLADAFIQSDLQLHSGYTFLTSMCVPWESNLQPLRCLRNALPLRHTGTRLQSVCRSEWRTQLYQLAHC